MSNYLNVSCLFGLMEKRYVCKALSIKDLSSKENIDNTPVIQAGILTNSCLLVDSYTKQSKSFTGHMDNCLDVGCLFGLMEKGTYIKF